MYPWALLSFVLISIGGGAWAHGVHECQKIFLPSGRIDRALESNLLSNFDPNELQSVEQLRSLSLGVFEVDLGGGHTGVLRLAYGDNRSDVRFERFAGELFAMAPSVTTGKVRPILLAGKAAQVAREFLNDQIPKWREIDESDNFDDLLRSVSPIPTSLMVFFPETTKAGEYLDQNFAADLRFKLGTLEFFKSPTHHQDLLTRWQQISSEQRQAILEDAAKVFPVLQFMSHDQFMDALHVVWQTVPYSTRDSVLEKWAHLSSQDVYARLPKHLQAKIADQWALTFVLGIPDFHPGNWLLHHPESEDASVVGIDFAQRSWGFDFGISDLYLLQDPISGKLMNTAFIELLQRHLSPAIQKFLVELTKEQVELAARKADYPLTSAALKGVLNRARRVVTPSADL